MNLPEVVSQKQWNAAQEALRAKEKAAMKEGDALAAERRRLPRLRVEKDYSFDGPGGKASLAELFEGRRQLVLYHFMFGPNQEAGCDGCSMFVDQLGHLAHVNTRDTTFALTSRAPLSKIEPFRKRMGWQVPWYSWAGGDFGIDFGTSPAEPNPDRHQDGEGFGLSAFLFEDGEVYRTYFTNSRGVEAIGSVWSILDRTALGRQESWEDSPDGYPQTPPYEWWQFHDSYEEESR
jgi:predicted dithiol-disulfide oxidoreductase (DUF899 family)